MKRNIDELPKLANEILPEQSPWAKSRPQTPYRILRESGQLSPDQVKALDQLYRSLNPADLKRRIDKKLKRLYTLYEKKRKGSVRVNPYRKLDPSSVTFFVMQ